MARRPENGWKSRVRTGLVSCQLICTVPPFISCGFSCLFLGKVKEIFLGFIFLGEEKDREKEFFSGILVLKWREMGGSAF